MDVKAIRAEALRQIHEENFAAAVRAAKERIRRRRWWQLPFTITITFTRRPT